MTDAILPLHDSALSLYATRLESGAELFVSDNERDALLYISAGEGLLMTESPTLVTHELTAGSAALVQAAEPAALSAVSELVVVRALVDESADRHAPLGRREHVVRSAEAAPDKATGARSFQILFGPNNGSTRATLFLGFIPPGKAPWHYHLYDEIVWVPSGPGLLHLGGETEELGAGSAFRLRPRQIHIVENSSPDAEMTILGIFTPAGSPSAAYLTPDVAAEYRFVDAQGE